MSRILLELNALIKEINYKRKKNGGTKPWKLNNTIINTRSNIKAKIFRKNIIKTYYINSSGTQQNGL